MKLLMIACSKRAYEGMNRLRRQWLEQDDTVELHCVVKCKSLPEQSMSQSVGDCVAEWFGQVDGIVFFSAAGIAVRSIAPCLSHKSVDPAVVVVDEAGQFCISLLSGHAGGANELTRKIAQLTGATPVITTATDREGCFAVDEFARQQGLYLTDWTLAKEISAAVLEGKPLGLFLEEGISFPGTVPDCFCEGQPELGVAIAWHSLEVLPRERLFPKTLQLVPRVITVGIGCRKNTPMEKLAAAVSVCLQEAGIHSQAVARLATIDLKMEEPGLLAYAEKNKIPLQSFSAEELNAIKGDFTKSPFVEQVTGVSNVCERSAVAASPQGKLIRGKWVYDGVTVALAR
jgi:cobalt-precorrin 5A hydrolase